MKKKRVLFLLLLLCFSLSGLAFGAQEDVPAEISELLEREFEALELSQWEQAFRELPGFFQKALGFPSLKSLFLGGNTDLLHYEVLGEGLKECLYTLLPELMEILWGIPAIAFACSLFSALVTKKELQELLQLFCGALALGRLLTLFGSLFREAEQVIENLSRLTEASIPLLSTLLTAVGGSVSGELIGRSMQFLGGSMLLVLRDWILPILSASAASGMLSVICSRPGLLYLHRFLRQLCRWVLGLSASLYVGAMSIHGLMGKSLDSLAFRTARFTLDHSLPVVGGAISGTADIAWTCAMLLKNGAGLCFTLLSLGYVFTPLLKAALSGLLLRLAAGLCALLGEESFPRLLQECAGLCELLCAVLFVSAFLLLLVAVQITGLGGGF